MSNVESAQLFTPWFTTGHQGADGISESEAWLGRQATPVVIRASTGVANWPASKYLIESRPDWLF